MTRTVLVGCVLAIISGCAFSAQRVNLAPEVRVYGSPIGGGAPVFVNSVDERPSEVLGVRGGQGIGAPVSAGNVHLVVKAALEDGLRQLGFAPVAQHTNGIPELRVEIRALEYKIATGLFAGGLDVNGALKAFCVVGERRPYEQLYRGRHEETLLVVPSAGQNTQYINSALSRAIESVLTDKDLLGCLQAEGSGT